MSTTTKTKLGKLGWNLVHEEDGRVVAERKAPPYARIAGDDVEHAVAQAKAYDAERTAKGLS